MDMTEKIKDIILVDARVSDAIGMVDDDVRRLKTAEDYVEKEFTEIVRLVDKLANSKIYLAEDAKTLSGKLVLFRSLYNDRGTYGSIIARNCNLDVAIGALKDWQARTPVILGYAKKDIDSAVLGLQMMLDNYVKSALNDAYLSANGAVRADGGYKFAVGAINKAEQQINHNYNANEDLKTYETMRDVFKTTKLPNGRMLLDYYLKNKRLDRPTASSAGGQFGE